MTGLIRRKIRKRFVNGKSRTAPVCPEKFRRKAIYRRIQTLPAFASAGFPGPALRVTWHRQRSPGLKDVPENPNSAKRTHFPQNHFQFEFNTAIS